MVRVHIVLLKIACGKTEEKNQRFGSNRVCLSSRLRPCDVAYFCFCLERQEDEQDDVAFHIAWQTTRARGYVVFHTVQQVEGGDRDRDVAFHAVWSGEEGDGDSSVAFHLQRSRWREKRKRSRLASAKTYIDGSLKPVNKFLLEFLQDILKYEIICER